MELIFCGDVRIFIPNSAKFSFVREKKQTDKQRNTHKFENRLSRQAGVGGGANIFCSCSGCLLEMSENLSPIVHSFHFEF